MCILSVYTLLKQVLSAREIMFYKLWRPLTVKYETRRTKPAGAGALRIGQFLTACYHDASITLFTLNPPTFPAKCTIIIGHTFSCVLYDSLLSHVWYLLLAYYVGFPLCMMSTYLLCF